MRPLITLAVAGLPATSLAQTNCDERDIVIDKLASGYGEAFTGGGLQSTSRIIEVWTSAEDGTWTILMTMPDGRSCVMAAGTNWREALPEDRLSGVPG